MRFLFLLIGMAACGGSGEGPERSGDPDDPAPVPRAERAVLEPVDPGVDVVLQAVSAVSPEVVWISGHQGTWIRSEDGGATWVRGTVPGHESLQFRDVHAFEDGSAVLMSAGQGPASRIVRTADGGSTWRETYVMNEPAGFLDCMDFWDDRRGLAYGDAVDGGLFVLRTGDGGRSWSRVPPDRLPDALEGEGGFAASGSCLRTVPGGVAWIGTGNGARPRLLVTRDGGASWEARGLPLAAGAGRGATSVGLRPDGLGFAVGGAVAGDSAGQRVALTADGGLSWSTAGDLSMEGPAYGAAWVPGRTPATFVVVGPGGMDWTRDGGLSWESLSDAGPYWAVEFASPDLGWAVGSGGLVTRIRLKP